MTDTEKFAPTVMVDGSSVQPEGWMWILSFAIGGCDWAVKIASEPEFDLRGKMADYNRRHNIYHTEQMIERLERDLAAARATMRKLQP